WGIPCTYRIVGSGDYLQAIRYMIFELNLEEVVELVGEMSASEIRDELEGAHAFLHPAISEGFCNAVVEAQAMEIPVVCSNADGLSENIEHKITGFVVPKWDVEGLAMMLKVLFNDPKRAEAMGSAGRI